MNGIERFILGRHVRVEVGSFFGRIAMIRLLVLLSLSVACVALAQEPKAEDLSKKPPYERLLKGDDLKKAERFKKQIDELTKAEKYVEAKKAAQELIEFRTQRQGADHYEVTDARVRLDAIEIIRKLSPIDREKLQEVGRQYQQMTALNQQGQFAAAARIGEQALSIIKKLFGESHLSYATNLHSLAVRRQSLSPFSGN
jgi:tetratricopeptide (TPR) repeat protein